MLIFNLPDDLRLYTLHPIPRIPENSEGKNEVFGMKDGVGSLNTKCIYRRGLICSVRLVGERHGEPRQPVYLVYHIAQRAPSVGPITRSRA